MKMEYIPIEANGREYKLKLSTRGIINLERKLGGKSPLTVLMSSLSGENLPTLDFIASTMHAALGKYHPGISQENTYDIVDDLLGPGEQDITDLIALLVDVFKTGGLVPEEKEETNPEALGELQGTQLMKN